MAVSSRQGMRVRELEFTDFRSYSHFILPEIGDLTIFVGKNGAGKTNVLEGIQLMTSGTSFRHSQISQLIRQGCDFSRVRVELSDENRSITTELSLEPGKKRYAVNGKAKGIADIRGVLPAVAFTPDDLELAKKSSSVKRDALDALGVQLTRNYSIVRRDFEKTLRYKNRLLKDEQSRALIESINETLVTCGSQLFCYRRALFSRLIPLVQKNYRSIVGERGSSAEPPEEFTACYEPSWNHMGSEETVELDERGVAPRDQVRELMFSNLERCYEEERSRKRSLVGPHNDKIRFFLDGRDASDFASQGQQRSIVLAWKLAEVELARHSLGVSPVLLLDDVMSELDSTRRDMLVGFVTDEIQTFITATDLTAFSQPLLTRASIIEI